MYVHFKIFFSLWQWLCIDLHSLLSLYYSNWNVFGAIFSPFNFAQFNCFLMAQVCCSNHSSKNIDFNENLTWPSLLTFLDPYTTPVLPQRPLSPKVTFCILLCELTHITYIVFFGTMLHCGSKGERMHAWPMDFQQHTQAVVVNICQGVRLWLG